MIKKLLLLSVLLLAGCTAGEFIEGLFTSPVEGGQAPVQTAMGLLGPLGTAVGGLLVAAYSGHKSYKVHNSKKEFIKTLGQDAYHQYDSMSDTDKAALDRDVRNLVPSQYRKYYDQGKKVIT